MKEYKGMAFKDIDASEEEDKSKEKKRKKKD